MYGIGACVTIENGQRFKRLFPGLVLIIRSDGSAGSSFNLNA